MLLKVKQDIGYCKRGLVVRCDVIGIVLFSNVNVCGCFRQVLAEIKTCE